MYSHSHTPYSLQAQAGGEENMLNLVSNRSVADGISPASLLRGAVGGAAKCRRVTTQRRVGFISIRQLAKGSVEAFRGHTMYNIFSANAGSQSRHEMLGRWFDDDEMTMPRQLEPSETTIRFPLPAEFGSITVVRT